MKISDIDNFQEFVGFYLIKNAQIRTTRTGKDFLALVFQDDTGEIEGNIWNVQQDQIDMYKPGTIVFVSGTRKDFAGTPQIAFNKIRLTHEDEPSDPKEFRTPSPVDAEEIKSRLENDFLNEIENLTLRSITEFILSKYSDQFYTYPAAKINHHAFESGLAFHTITMLETAAALSKIYKLVNRDLLFAGIILHDLAKTIELTGVDNTDYTIRGSLIGHIVLIDEEISKAVAALEIDEDSEDVMLLRHMILSHHGKLEFGSPTCPKIIEAELLHQIDNIDARMMMIATALEKTETGHMSQKVFGLENRSFYKHEL